MRKSMAFFRNDRGILWGATTIFVALALLFAGLVLWRAINLQQSTKANFRDQAEIVATRTADAVAVNINARFHDLAFLKNAFFAEGTGRLLPSAQVLSAFAAFQHTHPAVSAINIQDPSGDRIVWSSVKQPARPITPDKDFSPLPGYPDRFLGRVAHAQRTHAWVLTMRQRIRDNEGHVLGFIGSPFLLANLGMIHTPPELQSVVVMRPHGQVVSVWKDGRWMPPDTPLAPVDGEVVVPVPGYPWDLHVQWTAAALNHAFWQVERTRLPIFLMGLFFIAGMGTLTRRLLRRLLRLRQYQAAAVLAQQDLLRQNDPKVMYQRLVEVVVEQTEAIGAYIAVPEAGSEWLRVAAASADAPDLRQAMEQLTPSKDPAHFPYGNMVPSLAFREKTPQGPVSPGQSPAMTAVQRQQAPLSRIRSVMAYPVFLCEEREPTAVLVIESDSSRHFTQSLQRLLGQLAVTLGLALTQWRHHRELIEKDAEIQQMAFYDDLTALPNRRFLEIQMEQDMARAERHNRLLAVCMLDLDGFKPVNDTYGHEAGDEVLVELGKRLPEALRRSDFVARLGGDEFVLLVEDLADLGDLTQTLKKVEDTIAAPIRLSNGETIRIGASMGIFLYPFGDGETADQLLRWSDQALYESKAHKADREHPWVLFGEEVRKAQRTPAQHLLDAGALEVWYQPILDNRARKVVGVEALARLRDAEGKIWPPAEFLPQLRDADFFDLSKKVFAQALADLPILDAQGWSLWVSVNVDPRSVSEACIACLREMITLGAVDPSRITLEILEGSDFLEQQAALEHLLEMKALGVRLALDDVGSAYASLLRLKDLPIDEIKLDQAFVRTLEKRPQDLHFVGATQDLASGMGVNLVVEGVETDDIFDAVTVMGAPLLQGYAIAKPLPLAELQEFLQHTPSHHRRHPTGLLGLYAAQLANHSALKKAIRQNPRLVDYMTLVDATTCPIHDDMRRLGVDDGGPLDRLHQEYHRAIAVMDALLISSPANDDWSAVERAEKALEQAIIEAFWKSKAEDGNPLSSG
ncbi:MAG: EAL domain-containing protein [Gammaproteobacteria bacterium]|nr:EAL domain-containing protein [Gammaproteobacteria bacterium]